MWECGLKQADNQDHRRGKYVTPYVGVWIETTSEPQRPQRQRVTPYVGVWIETKKR